MKIRKILISLVLSIFMMCSLMTISYAFPGNYWWYPNNMHVRIFHPASGMYLGIAPDGNEQNGARLQLQKYQEGNQLQIFYLKFIKTDSSGHRYYQIRVHGENGKIVEVRNNSCDDWGEVAQWDEHTNPSALWSFFTQDAHDGSDSPVCCIKNLNSGKLLNVAGGNYSAGNDMIQHHEDGTRSEEFQILNVEEQISGAIWTADWSDRGISFGLQKDTKSARRSHKTPISRIVGDYIQYPFVFDEDKWYLASVAYLDSNMQKKIIMMHDTDLFKTVGDKLKDYFWNSSKEAIVDKGLGTIGLGGIPSGTILGFVDIIMNGHSSTQWKRLAEYFKNNTYVRIETYYKFRSGWDYSMAYVIVGDKNPVYWDGNKSSIDTTFYDSDNSIVDGTIEYFYK